MIKINKQGCTRIVLVLKNKVIKIPTLKSYELFLCGLLANIREGQTYNYLKNRKDLAKVIRYNRFGIFLIMERVDVCDNDEALELFEFVNEKYKNDEFKELMLSDCKPSNWGRKNGILVKIDYGD